MEDEAADSDSAASAISLSSRSRSSHEALNQSPSRKRTREVLEGKASKATYSCTGVKSRGRGRPITTGARAERLLQKEAAKQARRNARDEEVLQEMMEWSHKMTVAKSRAEFSSREQTTAEMVQTIRTSCNVIYTAVSKSGHLQGPIQKVMKQALSTIAGVVETLVTRSDSEEIRRLSAQNESLKFQVEEMRKEILALKVERNVTAVPVEAPLAPLTPPVAKEAPTPDAGLEQMAVDNLPGPSKNKKKKKPAPTAAAPKAPAESIASGKAPSKRMPRKAAAPKAAPKDAPKAPTPTEVQAAGRPVAPVPSSGTSTTPTPGPSGTRRDLRRKGAKARREPAHPEPRPLPPPPTSMNEGWTTVVKRGKKKVSDKEPQVSTGAKQSSRPAAPKLRLPRSTAVLLTLQPGAQENGANFESLIRDAKARIDIASLGIEAVKFKPAKTGGKLLEIPGASSGDKADAFAAKLREVLPADQVRVSRPTVTADVRVSGLDDSVTKVEVADAVLKATGCSADAVRVGEIRQTYTGGATIVRVPVAVAKTLAKGRLLVGWVSAQVKVLARKPLKCYRCLEAGHVSAQCTCETDRRVGRRQTKRDAPGRSLLSLWQNISRI
ncbi:hypothetical protein ABMA28_015304 [Loxostege sticticalis]|uniref:CCHC-type domain-containing protein n=1 Tax=Loxostege sticticalis TaxID=481309 RepID=A0ABD0TCC7_LOXSC